MRNKNMHQLVSQIILNIINKLLPNPKVMLYNLNKTTKNNSYKLFTDFIFIVLTSTAEHSRTLPIQSIYTKSTGRQMSVGACSCSG